jgi:hypothetical protein
MDLHRGATARIVALHAYTPPSHVTYCRPFVERELVSRAQVPRHGSCSSPQERYAAMREATAVLDKLDRDAITRRDVEQLFGVSRPLASQLMHRFGATRVGSQLVLERADLIRTLKALRRGSQAQAAVARRTAVVTHLRQARLDAVRIPVTREVLQTHVAGLPAGVALGPGRIEVRFTSVPEALQKLFTLAQAITNDYERFVAIIRPPGERAGESPS